MVSSKWIRFKRWICMRFNHKLRFSHEFGGRSIYVCSRCKVINDKKSFDLGREVWHAARDRKKPKA